MADSIGIDLNMEAARLFAEGLGSIAVLPNSLIDVRARAEFVNHIDGPFLPDRDDLAFFQKLGMRITVIAERSRACMSDIQDGLVRVNIALRMWAGGLSAAKIIALETRSGPNTPDLRVRGMPIIEAIAAQDPIYAAGVEAAPAFKRLRGEPYSFDGVPPGSTVLRDQGQSPRP